MKRLLPVAAVATTAALLLTGCGSDNGGQSGETKKVTVGISQFVEHPRSTPPAKVSCRPSRTAATRRVRT